MQGRKKNRYCIVHFTQILQSTTLYFKDIYFSRFFFRTTKFGLEFSNSEIRLIKCSRFFRKLFRSCRAISIDVCLCIVKSLHIDQMTRQVGLCSVHQLKCEAAAHVQCVVVQAMTPKIVFWFLF